MARRKGMTQEQLTKELSIIELLLFDHQCLKRCISILTDHHASKPKKLSLAKEFLDCLHKHSVAEQKSVYKVLENHEELHFTILEAEVEHEMMNHKARHLKSKLLRIRSLSDETEAELKVLADLVRNHLREEESGMLPMLNAVIDDATLKELGADFLRLRKLTREDMDDYPILLNELKNWQLTVQKDSKQFLHKTERYLDSIKN